MWSSDCTHQQLGKTWESGNQPATGWKLKGSRKNYLRSLLKGLGCQWWILMRCWLGSQGWAPGVQLGLHWSYTPPAPARMQILREPGLEKALETRRWIGVRATHQCFKNAKCWVILKSTLRRLRGAQAFQDVAQEGWCTSPRVQTAGTPWTATAEHRETSMKWDRTWPKDSTWKTWGITPAPMSGIIFW